MRQTITTLRHSDSSSHTQQGSMDPTDDLVNRVHGLSDLELAVLLSLVSGEHCVIGTPHDGVDDLTDELRLITRDIFGLQCVSVNCHESMTLDDFSASLLLPGKALPVAVSGQRAEKWAQRSKCGSHSSGSGSVSSEVPDAGEVDLAFLHTASAHSPPSTCGDKMIPPAETPLAAGAAFTPSAALSLKNVVIARHLNLAPEAVQVQMLELLRMQHISTSAAPRPFLVVGVVAATRGFGCKDGREPHMTAHLNDFFCMGHWHNPEDGFPNLEEKAETADASSRKGGSERYAKSPRASQVHLREASPPLVSLEDIHRLAALSNAVRVDIEVLRYLTNVVAFLRMHRAVATVGPSASGLSSISPAATKHFKKLARCLATLHHLDYVTPALVALAARKTYLHRIRMTSGYGRDGSSSPRMAKPIAHERSMQWGSERAATESFMDGVTPEDVIEDVLASVVSPV